MKIAILEEFSGPPDIGIYSPSVEVSEQLCTAAQKVMRCE